jgi:hypothetical protein
MRAKVRDTEIYFDVEGAGLVPEGATMHERPVAFLIHGGPGADHTGFKPVLLAIYQSVAALQSCGNGKHACMSLTMRRSPRVNQEVLLRATFLG